MLFETGADAPVPFRHVAAELFHVCCTGTSSCALSGGREVRRAFGGELVAVAFQTIANSAFARLYASTKFFDIGSASFEPRATRASFSEHFLAAFGKLAAMCFEAAADPAFSRRYVLAELRDIRRARLRGRRSSSGGQKTDRGTGKNGENLSCVDHDPSSFCAQGRLRWAREIVLR
jgi:hypothetical protein